MGAAPTLIVIAMIGLVGTWVSKQWLALDKALSPWLSARQDECEARAAPLFESSAVRRNEAQRER